MATTSVTSHILVLPYPAQGHIPPLLNLSKKLAARGALVTLVNVESIHSRLKLQVWPSNIRLRSLEFPYCIPYGYDASCHLDQQKFVQALRAAQETFEALLESILGEDQQPRVSCVVADYLWGWHLESAKRFDITGASYWPGSATWSTVHYHLPLLISAGDAPIEESSAEKVIDYVPGITPTKLSDFPYYARTTVKGTLEYLMEEQQKTTRCMDENSWFLINSTEDLEPDAFHAMREVFGNRCIGVGPLFPLNPPPGLFHSLRDEPQDSITWLNSQAPLSVLYISFGSVATLSQGELRALSRGLLKSSQSFLWVLRAEQEDQVLQEVFEGEFNGMIVSWAPQLQVLSHGSVGAFLSHCGWNSVFESLANGVPMLGWPCVVEQNLNCKLVVHDLEAGVQVSEANQVSEEEIKEAIESVMKKNSLVRRNAQKMGERIGKAPREDGCSYKSLNTFMQETCISL